MHVLGSTGRLSSTCEAVNKGSLSFHSLSGQ